MPIIYWLLTKFSGVVQAFARSVKAKETSGMTRALCCQLVFTENIPKGKPRNLKTYHSYCNPGWDVPNQSIFSWRLMKSFKPDGYLERWLQYAWISRFQYLVSWQLLVLFPEMTGILFLFVSRQGRLHFFRFGKSCAKPVYIDCSKYSHKHRSRLIVFW